MVKTKIIETTEKFDESGKLLERVTREETSEDDTIYYTQPTVTPYPQEWKPTWIGTCTTPLNYCEDVGKSNIRGTCI